MKRIIRIGLLVAALLMCLPGHAAVPAYDAAQAKANAQADFANWMKYLPDDVFVAHVSIPGTHDAATGEGWDTSSLATGPEYSTTQSTTLQQQLDGGIRAFDFRPGYKVSDTNPELWCYHGTDRTKMSFAKALQTLKTFLTAHPDEFLVMHLFRGNIYRTGEISKGAEFLGGRGNAASRETYNKLINGLFNEGTYADMFVEYSPYLKVKDVRGKVIVFRRDRIDFALINKAGNLWDWPGSEEMWSPGRKTSITLQSDPAVRGYMYATDVSSPDNDAQLETELNSITELFKWNCEQDKPNQFKKEKGYYKPDWTMMFTSGALYEEKTVGYKENATKTNPHLINLINEAASNGTSGPTGIVMSDWVLVDNVDNKYATKGTELVPAIINNNFDYIKDYILDSEQFPEGENPEESLWEANKQYFLRNVETGDFLSAGAGYTVKAVTSPFGVKVKFWKGDGKYYITSTFNSENSLGTDWYLDKSVDKEISTDGNGQTVTKYIRQYFDVIQVGHNRFVFKCSFANEGKAMGIEGIDAAHTYDGTANNVAGLDYNPDDPKQQWEVIGIDEYYQLQNSLAALSNPQNVTYKIPGARFYGNWGNDSENDSWSISTKKYTSRIEPLYSDGGYNDKTVFRAYAQKNGDSSGGEWSISQTIKGLEPGLYELRWIGYCTGITDVTASINNTNYTAGAAGSTDGLHTYTSWGQKKTDLSENFSKIALQELTETRDKFLCTTGQFEITNDGTLIIKFSAPNHGSATSFILDDFELIYYGPVYQNNWPLLARAVGDARVRLEEIGKSDDFLSEYVTLMQTQTYNKDVELAKVNEVYAKLREIALNQTIDPEEPTFYTGAIYDASFETGVLLGWNVMSKVNDTDAKLNSNGTYTYSNADRVYVFNAWDNHKGTVISQTIEGLPAGHYKLSAVAANYENNYVYFEVKADDEVRGQRSKAIKLPNNEKVGTLLEFEFDVNEGTKKVTICFGGCNLDGSWSDTGGRFYKVDDFRLVRLGDTDICPVYRHLQAAINDAKNVVEKTLKNTPYYHEWTPDDYQHIVDDHIGNEEHSHDPISGDDTNEVKEVYSSLRDVAFAQQRSGANLTGAISNHSFEMGDLTGWTCDALVNPDAAVVNGTEGDYATGMTDRQYIFNCSKEGHGYAIYQTIPNVPKGTYELKVLLAANGTINLGANGNYQAFALSDVDNFVQKTLEFTIDKDGTDLTIGVYPDPNQEKGMGNWYKADDFELYLKKRDLSIEWQMETDTHGTIILPFDVPADKLKDEGIEIYTLKTSGVSETPADPEVNSYHLLTYEEMTEKGLKAFTPYVVKDVKDVEAGKASAPRKASASDSDVREFTGRKITFTGTTSGAEYNERAPIDNHIQSIPGELVGTLVDHPVGANEHHLNVNKNEEYTNVGFIYHEDASSNSLEGDYNTGEIIPAYHAYMLNQVKVTMSDGTSRYVTEYYFGEPTLPIRWSMEGEHYGTIILPFRAPIPDEFYNEDVNLRVYRIIGLDGPHAYMDPATQKELFKYSVLKRQDVEGYFEPNVPYIVMTPFADLEAPSPAQLRRKAAPASDTAGEGYSNDFYGKATNREATYTDEVLTGVLKTTQVDAQHYSLYQNGETGHFQRGPEPESEEDEYAPAAVAETGTNSTTLPAYHAYINADKNPNQNFLFFAAPNEEQVSGIEDVMSGEAGNVDVYNIDGVLLRSDIPVAEALKDLSRGIYIIVCGETTLKVLK